MTTRNRKGTTPTKAELRTALARAWSMLLEEMMAEPEILNCAIEDMKPEDRLFLEKAITRPNHPSYPQS